MIFLILLFLFFVCAVFWDKSNGIKMRDNLAHGRTGYKIKKLSRKQAAAMTPAQRAAFYEMEMRKYRGF